MVENKVIIEAELSTKTFDAQINELEDKLDTLLQEYQGALKSGDFPEDELKKYEAEIEKTTNKIVSLREKQEEINNQGFRDVQGSLENVGNSLKGVINKVIRWGLAIFGIRSAYMLVRNAMNTITSEDAQLKADIDYMKNLLAYALEPVVRRIVELMKTLVAYFGYLMNAWFHIDIFSKANAKALSSGVKSAKEMRNQLAGFDEMNVLQTDTSGGGGGGGATPSFNVEDVDIPKWMKWIGENGKELIPILLGIASGLTAIKLGLEPLKALGIGIAVWGIVSAVQTLLDYLKDPTWDKFADTISYIGIAVVGLGIAFGSLPLAVVGVGIAITGLVAKYWDDVKDTFNQRITDMETSIDEAKQRFGRTVGAVYEGIVKFLRETFDAVDGYFNGLKRMFDGIIGFVQHAFKGEWQKAFDDLYNIGAGMFRMLVGAWNTNFGLLINLASNLGMSMGNALTGAIKQGMNGVIYVIESQINGAIDLINGAIRLINKIPGVSISNVGRVSLPRLAQGGIVNNPGPGVMMGSYIAGERGAEAVLPLTDDTLQRLANMIPITVNVTNTMNGRVISRELKKVQNENDFAFNR